MVVKIKKLVENAVIPSYAKDGDAGMDLTAVSKIYDKFGNVSYGTGLAFEIPKGYVGLLFPRSSNCKQDLLLSNSVGVLDSNYRGEVFLKYKPSLFFADNSVENGDIGVDAETFEYVSLGKESIDDDFQPSSYEIGERVGQIIIIPYPQIQFEEVYELTETERGKEGFGSTGK